MEKNYTLYIWKKSPFLRVLLPVIFGILLEYYFKFEIKTIVIAALFFVALFILFNALPLLYRFQYNLVNGIIINLFIISIAAFTTWNKDSRNSNDWYGNISDSSSFIIASINEQPIEKDKSYKALANINAVIKNDKVYKVSGKVLLYFAKDSLSHLLCYGSTVLFKNKLQEIKNSSNPGAFDYKRYCAFQQIFHQAYLKESGWILLKENNFSYVRKIILSTQQAIVNIIDKNISGQQEASIAKALFIGYKVDLDKDIVQEYSNAGVIHIIVIAGLHLGLIYALLLWLINRIKFIKKYKRLRLAVILIFLWAFALLTGASSPVLRAVVMFTCIAFGNTLNKKSSVYNSLAASAFILLLYDPFYLWDAGFQLSYLAVTGIVVVHKYIFSWLFIRNKILREMWEIASVSMAAQLFTLPACLFYFHQMPLLFVFTNIVAIPLAIITLYGCILLVCISGFSTIAFYLGKFLHAVIWLLNHTVFFINEIPFSTWNDFSISFTQTILFYFTIISFLFWFIKKNKPAFKLALAFSLICTVIILFQKLNSFRQKKIIVYDVPNHKAIDFIDGNTFHFVGDSELTKDNLLQNFHLKPARISLFANKKIDNNLPFFYQANFYQFGDKRIVMLDSSTVYLSGKQKIIVDYIIISKNPKLYISRVAETFNCKMYIFDASNPLWKIAKWKKDCEDLHLRSHSVPEQGAFIIDL